ncbi:MAG: HD domain-containing protein [Candidatus Omnitrophica bacterium]|nr:HD domain-containing protein [Candidatus Omnitrophota bacterium]
MLNSFPEDNQDAVSQKSGQFASFKQRQTQRLEGSYCDPIEDVALIQLYLELSEVVRMSLDGNIKREKIEGVIGKIADVFNQQLYNNLLLYFYSVSKDHYLTIHIVNDVILSIGFAVSLGLPREDVMEIGTCAFCHDFGMLQYTHLFQKNHELEQAENELFKQHPVKSAEIFQPHFGAKILQSILDVHEYTNGQGYPKGKKGSEISQIAKIVAICDVYEALTHPRNFRKPYNPYTAMKTIIQRKDSTFDPYVVKKFLSFLSIYPIGSFVSLSTSEVAVVIASNRGFPSMPIVRLLLNNQHEIDRSKKVINLLDQSMINITSTISEKEEEEVLRVLKPRGDFDL